MATIQSVNNGDSGLTARTKINNNDANINAALESAETTLANLGTASTKDVGAAIGNIQENGAAIGNSQTVETDAAGKLITAAKNTAYNANFGTGNTDVARGDASYIKNDTYTKAEANALLLVKQDTSDKGVANGYASLDGNAQVPLSQLPANAKSSKVVADITARNAIASADRFEGLRVHVLNATADGTVTSGSAGYILKSGLANTDWEKTYESESLDIDLSDYFNKTTDTTDDITAGTAKFTNQADIDKLAGIEANATADQTDSEIKTAYESNANTNAFTDAEKTKLSNIATGATANSTDATLLNRANHTGTQTLSTISDAGLLAAKNTIATGDVDNNAITTAKIQQIVTKSILGRTSAGTGDVEEIDIATTLKTDLSLNNVDNTSDTDKPVSTAQQTALDGKLAKASNLSDVADRQTAANNLTDVASANNEYVLTKDTTTGNAEWKPAAGGGSGTNLSIGTTTATTVDVNSDTGNNATIPAATTSVAGLLVATDKTKLDNTSGINTGDEVAATETVAGIGEIVTQVEAETGTDNTNKFLNALRNKQAFDAFISAYESQKILSTRIQPNEISYNSDIAVETPTSQTSQGSITYSSGSYTVSKDCILQISATISFRNNGSASTDPCSIEVRRASSGIPFGTFVTLAANPSNLVNSQQNLLQSITPVVISLNNGDSIQIYIKGVNLTQFITNAVVTIIEL